MIALPCMPYSMDLTVLNLAVPRLIADLKPSSTQLLWIVDIYGFVPPGALIAGGLGCARTLVADALNGPPRGHRR